jgi:hypothetical protein
MCPAGLDINALPPDDDWGSAKDKESTHGSEWQNGLGQYADHNNDHKNGIEHAHDLIELFDPMHML